MKTVLKVLVLLLLIGIAAIVFGGYYFSSLSRPVAAENKTRVAFHIPKGQSLSVIAQRLSDASLIRQPLVFRAVVWQQKLGTKIQAGDFSLSPSMSTYEIAQQLTMGTSDAWITILEGWRNEEIADMLVDQKLDNFDKAAFLAQAKDQSGYLFPDTYQIQKSITTDALIARLRDTFDRKVTKGLASQISSSGHELPEIVNLASIVQREARGSEQMNIVAGILWHRLQLGMPLDVDATLQYAKGYDASLHTWWPQPLADDRAHVSPYNTYLNAGLPPQPISNPGLDALKAVINTPASDYLFYIHDAQGQIHYAKTLEEHNANVQKYLR